LDEPERKPERREARQDEAAVDVGTAGEDAAERRKQAKRASGVVRPAADPRWTALDAVDRGVPDDGEPVDAQPLAGERTPRRANVLTPNASAKESAKLGNDAPICESSGWSRARKSLQNPSPSDCASHS
jgi:hypothetical protein